ncbi:MAG: hypothetical protein IJS90_07085 [Clostridia bacterium]|nr:hypothetical protein [Clostridia bacterium]
MGRSGGFVKAARLFGDKTEKLLISCAGSVENEIYEIRLYIGCAVALCSKNGVVFCLENGGVSTFPGPGLLVPSACDARSVLGAAAGDGVFLKEDELKSGYFTKDGVRVSFCGVSPQGTLFPEGISSVNIRIPYENGLLDLTEEETALLKSSGGVLVAGPPASGKTTFLKKCACALSGGRLGRFYKTAVIDERGEFFPSLSAAAGAVTVDIVRGRGKADGIETAVRLLSPDYIICDEIGNGDEADKMLEGMNSGVVFLASIHASCIRELKLRPQFRKLWDNGVFGSVCFLSREKKGRITEICKRGEGDK